MQLTGIIIFFGSLIGFSIWLYAQLQKFSNIEKIVLRMRGEDLIFDMMPGIILFIIMAIGAGMAWG